MNAKRYEVTDVIKCPYGKPGDVHWVRETWQHDIKIDIDAIPLEWIPNGKYVYAADGTVISKKELGKLGVWRPSIYMPKPACRIWLEVIDISVERLQGISEADALCEGVDLSFDYSMYLTTLKDNPTVPKHLAGIAYMDLWGRINGIKSWDANPWVWVIKFKEIPNPTNFL